MRLSKKSKAILELLFMTGMDALEALTYSRAKLYGNSGYEDERAYRRLLKAMETKGWIEFSKNQENEDWIPQITKIGSDLINDDLNPPSEWSRGWNGNWTTIAFDIPAKARDQRWQLDQWLSKRRFGRLQGSLWISHRQNEDFATELAGRNIDLSSIVVLHGQVRSSKTPQQIASDSWNFESINQNYRTYLDFLANNPPPQQSAASESTSAWFEKESQTWRTAFASDPFLPDALLPAQYLGKTAWSKRTESYRQALLDQPDQ